MSKLLSAFAEVLAKLRELWQDGRSEGDAASGLCREMMDLHGAMDPAERSEASQMGGVWHD